MLIYCTSISGNISILSNLLSLKIIWLGYNDIYGNIESLSNFPVIERIDLRGLPNLTGSIDSLSNLLSTAYWIELTDSPNITGDISIFANYPDITVIALNNCPNISGSVNSLANITKLTQVFVNT